MASTEQTGGHKTPIPTNVSSFTNDAGYLTLATLPPDSDNQNLTANNTGGVTTGITISGGNTIAINHPPAQTLNVTKLPLYRYEAVTAEESGNAVTGSSQWSTGNGATGFIGIPVDDGWEVTDMSFHADNGGSAGESMELHLVDMRVPSFQAPIIATLRITGAGDGVDNNAYTFVEFTPALVIPDGAVLGFRTGREIGTWGNMRIRAGIRKEVGQYVSDVTIS